MAAALAIAAIAAHVAYGYLPRTRAGVVDPGSPAGELFTGGAQTVRVWLAYPHQNLGAASRQIEDPAAAIGAAARLAGLGRLELPAFGPFALPPSRAIAIAVEPGGEDLAVAVEVFPVLAVVARIAGVVAGNPVLRGGGIEVSGRRLEVAWRGSAWTLRSAAAPERTVRGQERPRGGPALAFVVLEERLGAVGPGVYRLRREGEHLVLGSPAAGGRDALAELAEVRAREHDLAFLGLRAERVAGAAEPREDAAEPGVAAADPRGAATVLLLPRSGAGDERLRLPDAAVAWESGARRWELPGENVLRLLDLDPAETRSGEWTVLALERQSLAVAARLAPELEAAAARAGVDLLLWVRPREYLPLVAAIAAVLERLPFAPREEAQRWRDVRTVLEALAPIDRVRVVIAATGAEARLSVG